jgi:pyroglutamyl-peptidase
MTLPVVGGTAPGSARAAIDAAIDALQPDAVVMFGEAHTRGEISIERVAINLRDYAIADNGGTTVHDQPVVAGAPDALFAALPVRRMHEAVAMSGVPVGLSLSAGTYLCNELMFHVLERRRVAGAPRYAGFIHVPQLPVQAALRPVAAHPMPLPQLERGARTALAGLAAEWTRETERRLEIA